MDDIRNWAEEQAACADFGDVRRERRFCKMLRRAAERPAGRITEVFERPDERQAAYGGLAWPIPPSRILDTLAAATLRAVTTPFVYIALDGTGLSLTDRAKRKGLGAIGSGSFPTRGLKVVTALAIEPNGTTLGLLHQQYWARVRPKDPSRYRRRANHQTEASHWVESIHRTAERLQHSDVTPWFVLDREGDNAGMLRAIKAAQASFTVRACHDRTLAGRPKKHGGLKSYMKRRSVTAQHSVDVSPGPHRAGRTAKLAVRCARVVLDLPDYEEGWNRRSTLEVNVVWAHEHRAPRGEKPLDWMLLTDRPIDTPENILAVIDSYTRRWRVEDFHRTWKRGACNVEETQLHHRERIVRWAIMLAAVATRAERLKLLARTQPDAPASIEFTEIERQVIVLVARTIKKKNEEVPDELTMKEAVEWIARKGGYTGKSSGGPPGSQTIARGLDRLAPIIDGFTLGLKIAKKMR